MRRRFGLFPDRHSFPFLFKACARLSLSHKGQELHSLTFKLGLQHNVFVQNALLSMYSFCGLLHNARQVFDEIPLSVRDVVSWNSMVSGYIQGLCYWDALKMFDEMLKCDVNTRPDEVTLINALTACARIGFLDMGRKTHGLLESIELFREMQARGVTADAATIACIISSCGHSGALDQGRLAIGEKQDQLLCHHRRLPTIILQINAQSQLKFATDSPPSGNYFHHLRIKFLFGSRKDKLNQLQNNQSLVNCQHFIGWSIIQFILNSLKNCNARFSKRLLL
ncbi:hypothetical protein SO802_007829 [Lithocarpus litseifolius]|uniref:Pentatricopeptide repeat-containing protein n=1 Tax=Lithocarpus litseifolius TaxID=425828 RepID=A0AAW2DUT3_9ROSI